MDRVAFACYAVKILSDMFKISDKIQTNKKIGNRYVNKISIFWEFIIVKLGQV